MTVAWGPRRWRQLLRACPRTHPRTHPLVFHNGPEAARRPRMCTLPLHTWARAFAHRRGSRVRPHLGGARALDDPRRCVAFGGHGVLRFCEAPAAMLSVGGVDCLARAATNSGAAARRRGRGVGRRRRVGIESGRVSGTACAAQKIDPFGSTLAKTSFAPQYKRACAGCTSSGLRCVATVFGSASLCKQTSVVAAVLWERSFVCRATWSSAPTMGGSSQDRIY